MNTLFKTRAQSYGNKYKDHLLAQYQLYVDSIEKISDRRQNANNYFLTINTVLFSVFSLMLKNNDCSSDVFLLELIFPIIGIIFCVIFWYLIRAYKQLNAGKFEILHKIEEKLPISIYKSEWLILGEGKNKKLYYPFSHIELFIPWVFGFMYAIIAIFSLINY
jgi:hypothetical protein